ncbi:histidine triad protein D [Streptococcus pneumoniae]|uniref:pneumococcal-type histidine triad protein n=1 Tax=Streptococcus pneumoniae TaxID=1313 RepID=UPI0010247FF2|nr:pneumococcal-type histidine triad protein [Streptococcus pneumoniae]VFH77148.1 histidine triad protein D [Streptococcus pneumoniae]
MKINKKYLAGSVAVLALSVCSYELGRYQAGQDKKESNRVACGSPCPKCLFL